MSLFKGAQTFAIMLGVRSDAVVAPPAERSNTKAPLFLYEALDVVVCSRAKLNVAPTVIGKLVVDTHNLLLAVELIANLSQANSHVG